MSAPSGEKGRTLSLSDAKAGRANAMFPARQVASRGSVCWQRKPKRRDEWTGGENEPQDERRRVVGVVLLFLCRLQNRRARVWRDSVGAARGSGGGRGELSCLRF